MKVLEDVETKQNTNKAKFEKFLAKNTQYLNCSRQEKLILANKFNIALRDIEEMISRKKVY